jgi:hypothetical protein
VAVGLWGAAMGILNKATSTELTYNRWGGGCTQTRGKRALHFAGMRLRTAHFPTRHTVTCHVHVEWCVAACCTHSVACHMEWATSRTAGHGVSGGASRVYAFHWNNGGGWYAQGRMCRVAYTSLLVPSAPSACMHGAKSGCSRVLRVPALRAYTVLLCRCCAAVVPLL